MKRSLILFGIVVMALALVSRANAQTGRGRGFVAEARAAAETIPGLRGFSVVLVQGDLKSGTTASGETVPAAAAKALADLKDFLPYKNYKLLDTQWTMGSGQMTGRLSGPEGKSYNLELHTQRGSTAEAPVIVSRFLLREGPWFSGNASENRVLQLYQQGLVARSQVPAVARGRYSMAAGSALIDTSFSMDIGETVVVGTSRLQGDTALIVLLTAVSRTDQSSRGGR